MGGIAFGGRYCVYRGADSLAACLASADADAPVAIVAAGSVTVDLVGLGHVADRDYFYIVRAVSDAGVIETNEDRFVRVRVDDQGALAGQPPNRLAWAEATPAAGGKIDFHFIYSARNEIGQAASIDVARVTDGQADWQSPLAQISISGSTRKTVQLPQTFEDRETVHLAARAVTAGGEAGQAISLMPVGADAEGPGHLEYLEVSQA